MSYEKMYKQSIENPQAFWGELAEDLHWYKKWDAVLDDSKAPFYRWFVGGETNICYNAVDRHALGDRRSQAAIIWVSNEVNEERVVTYFELYREVNRFAGVLKNLGVKKGDRVLIYLPMVVEALVTMLACVRLGAIHSLVFGGFSKDALAARIDDAEPVIAVTADAGMRKGKVVPLKPIVDEAMDVAQVDSIKNVVVLNRGLLEVEMKDGVDLDWTKAMEEKGELYVEPERVASTDPSYILYTSGTTGKPKGVVRDTAGYMVALYASMGQIYNVEPGKDVYWSTSDVGWVVGHSYIVYGPLLAGVTTIVYEGTPDYPNPGAWWKIIEQYGVTSVFSAPTALRALRKFPEHWMKDRDISSMQTFFSAGEPLDAPTFEWAKETLGLEVIDHYWQTESGWSMLTNPAGVELLPIKSGSPTKPAFGHRLEVVDPDGNPVAKGEKGFLVDHGPLPPGMLMTLWNDDDRYISSYWGHFKDKLMYMTGDYAIEDKDGYFWMLGRADEVMNVAGHRLGTRELEEVVSGHPVVAEASVIGVKDELKGEIPLVLVVVKQDVTASDHDAISKEITKMIRDSIGAIATPKAVHIVSTLPKTRSGKIMRRVIRAVYQGDQIGDLSTIEDGATVDMVREAVELMKGEL